MSTALNNLLKGDFLPQRILLLISHILRMSLNLLKQIIAIAYINLMSKHYCYGN